MNKLTAKQLFQINQQFSIVKDEYDEALRNKVTAVADMPYVQDERFFFIYKDTVEKAAKLGCSIAYWRPFRSANTKTAIISMLTLLEVNGIKLEGYSDDMDNLISIIEGDKVQECIGWIKKYKNDVNAQ